ncbi:DNA replication and repair protein RecF, partial [Candidatus Amoebophilus asiaticus]|nr:DNA replication and repair protein RecF [Candidatus Amoebophilus asiaticus]
QGQQKSYVIALKLAKFSFISQAKPFKPLLLLDDIFDKLDSFRVKNLMDIITSEEIGQVFITDSHPERLISIFTELNIKPRIFHVDNGIIDGN